ncbi:MAG TPA: hypothetical protein PLA94_20920 [Myxococcota bacterium]|nr:hypothetical protein [Myxococcota bacterium]
MKGVQESWLRQSRAEYRAAGRIAELTHWLITLGVRPDLLVRATRVLSDKVRHATLSRELYLHAGGSSDPVGLPSKQLIHADDVGAPVAFRALSAAGELACEESVSLAVFRLRQENARDPVARELCEGILRDGALHRVFAWELMDELLRLHGTAAVRAWVRPRLAGWLRRSLVAAPPPDQPGYSAEELAFGLMDRQPQWQAMQQALADDVLPHFRERDLLEAAATPTLLLAELAQQRATRRG